MPKAALRAARLTLARAEKVLAQDPNNGTVIAYSAYALGALGDVERAKERMNRAMLLHPDNGNALQLRLRTTSYLNEIDAALDMLGPVFRNDDDGLLEPRQGRSGPRSLRDHPRFKAMIAAAEARLAASLDESSTPTP